MISLISKDIVALDRDWLLHDAHQQVQPPPELQEQEWACLACFQKHLIAITNVMNILDILSHTDWFQIVFGTATSVYFGAESSKLVSLRQWGSSDMKVRWRGSWWGLGCHESGEERGIAQVEKWKIGDKGRGGEERTVRWGGGGGEWSKVERAVSYVFVWKLWKAVCLSALTETSPRLEL